MRYEWRAEDGVHELSLVAVPGTAREPYLFGAALPRLVAYGITPAAHDGCIGFRLALAPSA